MKNQQSAVKIEMTANRLGLDYSYTLVNGVDYLAVTLKKHVVAFFQVDYNTEDYFYAYTYNAATDKTTKRNPTGF